jgi:hypothetical protein
LAHPAVTIMFPMAAPRTITNTVFLILSSLSRFYEPSTPPAMTENPDVAKVEGAAGPRRSRVRL